MLDSNVVLNSFEASSAADPQGFLDKASSWVMKTGIQKADCESTATPQAPSHLLDGRRKEELIESLKVRGIIFESPEQLIAVRQVDGTSTLCSQAGVIKFQGPLAGLPGARKLDWTGAAEVINIYQSGDIHLLNPNGIYGSIKDNASTKIYFGVDNRGEMVVRSHDRDENDRMRPLAGELRMKHGSVEKTFVSPCEIRIGLDPIYGIRQSERYPRPTSAFVGRALHNEVITTVHTPTVGLTRIETADAAGNRTRTYHCTVV